MARRKLLLLAGVMVAIAFACSDSEESKPKPAPSCSCQTSEGATLACGAKQCVGRYETECRSDGTLSVMVAQCPGSPDPFNDNVSSTSGSPIPADAARTCQMGICTKNVDCGDGARCFTMRDAGAAFCYARETSLCPDDWPRASKPAEADASVALCYQPECGDPLTFVP